MTVDGPRRNEQKHCQIQNRPAAPPSDAAMVTGLDCREIEGMGAGLPMVVTDVGGNVESVEHGQTGLIVPPRNPAALGQAILSLVSDPAARQRMGQAGRKQAEQRFSIEACVEQYAGLYRSLIERRSAATETHFV